MSDIRTSFYQAVNKANIQQPKKTIKKFRNFEEVSVEDQIKNLLQESESAVIFPKSEYDNDTIVSCLYDATKKNEETKALEMKLAEEERLINELRDKARKEYRRRMRMLEFTAFNPSAAAAAASSSSSSAGAGAGAGGGRRPVNASTNSYVEDDYIDNYFE